MSLPFYTEIETVLDANGNGVLDFSNKPVPTYGPASVTLSTSGGLSGTGIVYIGNNQLGPIALAQGFGPFTVPPLGKVKIVITGGPTNGTVIGVLQGATYLPGEAVPAQNIQFATPDVQNSTVLVYETNVDASSQIRFGPFSTAAFIALALRVFGGPDMYTAGLDWFSDQAMTEETGSTEWTGDSEITAISDVWTNLGPWVRLTLTPHHSGCSGPPPWSLISLAPVAAEAVSLEHSSGIVLLLENGSLADGASASAQSVIVLTGSAVLSVTVSEAKAWQLELSWIDSTGTSHLFTKIQSDMEGWVQGIALPGYPILAQFTNDAGDASAQAVTVNIIKSPKGSGTPGQPGPAGGGGGSGVTSFNMRTGIVTFELTDIPNPLAAPDGDVLTLVGGVAEWEPPSGGGTINGKAIPDSLYGIPLIDFDAMRGERFTGGTPDGIVDLYRSGYWDATLYDPTGFPGGLPCLAFTGSQKADYSSQYDASPHSFAALIVFALNSIPGVYPVLGGATSGGTSIYIYDPGGGGILFQVTHNGIATGIEASWPSPDIGVPHLLTIVYEDDANGGPLLSYVHLDGNPMSITHYASGSTYFSTASPVFLGTDFASSGDFFDGQIGKVLILPDYCAPGTIATLETEIMTAWGI